MPPFLLSSLIACAPTEEPPADVSPADTADTTPEDTSGPDTSDDTAETDPPGGPTVAIASPSEGAVLAGVVVVGVEAAAEAGLVAVELRLDGADAAAGGTSPLAWTWDTCGAAGGAHALTGTARDAVGGEAQASIDVTVDQPLGVELFVDEPLGTTARLGARVSDDQAPATVTWTLDGVALAAAASGTEPVDGDGAPAYGACALGCPETCAWWEVSVDTTSWAEGSRTLTVTVTGAAGDVVSASRTVTIDHDQDGDGAVGEEWGGLDCDDADASVFPGAVEVCDGADTDCDGVIAADDADADGDGWPLCAGDCDDADPARSPGAAENLGNHVDEDCDTYAPNRRTVSSEDLSAADAKLVGEASYDSAGVAAAIVGDFDGDGYDDVVVGAYGRDDRAVASAGGAYVVYGPVSGTRDLSTADVTRWGTEAHDDAGREVASAGDLDGDGLPDVLVGAPGDDSGGTAAGAVWVLSGGSTGAQELADEPRILGDEAGLDLGYAADGAGDLDGDGLSDVLVGALDDDAGTEAGAVWLLHGPIVGDTSVADADAKLTGESTGDQAYVPAGGGDFDGDGTPDILVGAQESDAGGRYSGAAYVVLGPVSGTVGLAAADARFVGEDAEDYAGYAVAWGDVDRDGYDDALIGANRDDDGGSDAGAVYLVRGPVASMDLSLADGKALGAAGADYAGGSVAADDIDGDGYADLFASAPGADGGGSSAGNAYLLYGPWSGTMDLGAADLTLIGEDSEDFASLLGLGGDIDADGWNDLLVGATGDDDGGYGAGALYAVLSSTIGR